MRLTINVLVLFRVLCEANSKLSDYCQFIKQFGKEVETDQAPSKISIVKILEHMGKGAFGDVFKVLAKIPNLKEEMEVAVKKDFRKDETVLNEIMVYLALEAENKNREIESKNQHQHIPKFFGCLYEEPEESESPEEQIEVSGIKVEKSEDPEYPIPNNSGRESGKTQSLHPSSSILSPKSQVVAIQKISESSEFIGPTSELQPFQVERRSVISAEKDNYQAEYENKIVFEDKVENEPPLNFANKFSPHQKVETSKRNPEYKYPELDKSENPNKSPVNVYLVVELFEGSFQTLQKYLKLALKEPHFVDLDPIVRIDIYRQMIAAVAELHEAGIVHNDVKGNNFVWARKKDSKRNERVVKIIDFGLATFKGEASSRGANMYKDQVKYQIFLDERDNVPSALRNRKDHFLADVHALAMMIYRMENEDQELAVLSENQSTLDSCFYWRSSKKLADKKWVINRGLNLCDEKGKACFWKIIAAMVNPRSLEKEDQSIDIHTYTRKIADQFAQIVAGGGKFKDPYSAESEVLLPGVSSACSKAEEELMGQSSKIPINLPKMISV
jgi:serine/threonine protein kinase